MRSVMTTLPADRQTGESEAEPTFLACFLFAMRFSRNKPAQQKGGAELCHGHNTPILGGSAPE